jgi:hypothetical protein
MVSLPNFLLFFIAGHCGFLFWFVRDDFVVGSAVSGLHGFCGSDHAAMIMEQGR